MGLEETNMAPDIEYLVSNWPISPGEHKVIQFYFNEKPYLRFARLASTNPIHRELITDSLKEFKVEYDIIALLESECNSALGPLRVCGMGWAEVDLPSKIATLFGCSRQFNTPIDHAHAESLKVYLPEWTIRLGPADREPKKPY